LLEISEQLAPLVRDHLHLTEPVITVPKQVAQQDHARMQLVAHALQAWLVDLEHPDVALDPAAQSRGDQKRRRDTAIHVVAELVMHGANPAASYDVSRKRRGGRLSVGTRDQGRSSRQSLP
jgi:hypothetical protein